MKHTNRVTAKPGEDMSNIVPIFSSGEMIPLSRLKGLSFLYENDLHDLAGVLLRLDDGKSRGTNSKHRHTVHGLTRCFARLAELPESVVEAELLRRQISPLATVEHDASCNAARGEP